MKPITNEHVAAGVLSPDKSGGSCFPRVKIPDTESTQKKFWIPLYCERLAVNCIDIPGIVNLVFGPNAGRM